jgi:glucose-1-phosphate cytidylyltransferase
MKVVLFCGGLGLRIREAGENTPKPMVTVGYRPILWHVMKYYAHFGHKDFVLALGYRGDVIKNYFLNYSECLSNDFTLSEGGKKLDLMGSDIHDWKITFVETGLSSNIGQRLKAVERYVRDDPEFLANYSDGLSNLPLPEQLAQFRKQDAVASFVSVKPPLSYHIVSAMATVASRHSGDRPDQHPHQRRLLHPEASDLRLHAAWRGAGRRAVPAPGPGVAAGSLRVRRLLAVNGHVQGPPGSRRVLLEGQTTMAAVERGGAGTGRDLSARARVEDRPRQNVQPLLCTHCTRRRRLALFECSVSAPIPTTSKSARAA